MRVQGCSKKTLQDQGDMTERIVGSVIGLDLDSLEQRPHEVAGEETARHYFLINGPTFVVLFHRNCNSSWAIKQNSLPNKWVWLNSYSERLEWKIWLLKKMICSGV